MARKQKRPSGVAGTVQGRCDRHSNRHKSGRNVVCPMSKYSSLVVFIVVFDGDNNYSGYWTLWKGLTAHPPPGSWISWSPQSMSGGSPGHPPRGIMKDSSHPLRFCLFSVRSPFLPAPDLFSTGQQLLPGSLSRLTSPSEVVVLLSSRLQPTWSAFLHRLHLHLRRLPAPLRPRPSCPPAAAGRRHCTQWP